MAGDLSLSLSAVFVDLIWGGTASKRKKKKKRKEKRGQPCVGGRSTAANWPPTEIGQLFFSCYDFYKNCPILALSFS
jgi:hypothetical protein